MCLQDGNPDHGQVRRPNKRVESDSLRRRFAPPPLAAHKEQGGSSLEMSVLETRSTGLQDFGFNPVNLEKSC